MQTTAWKNIGCRYCTIQTNSRQAYREFYDVYDKNAGKTVYAQIVFGTHDYSNKLHLISGLIQLESYWTKYPAI
ncbi:hypothetical protein EN829_042120 [Mesorhizobium sp. M00.F.Ca.ET.186.01.1.1]|nr:hypothetical protein EN829_042120 [Mesorhizobium sp. M00.F.Ca.ET.186.01.1.1]